MSPELSASRAADRSGWAGERGTAHDGVVVLAYCTIWTCLVAGDPVLYSLQSRWNFRSVPGTIQHNTYILPWSRQTIIVSTATSSVNISNGTQAVSAISSM